MATKPRWTKDARAYFDRRWEGGAGSPKHIAATCCELCAYYGGTMVNRDAVDRGLRALESLRFGMQPFPGVRVETVYPYRALIDQGLPGEQLMFNLG